MLNKSKYLPALLAALFNCMQAIAQFSENTDSLVQEKIPGNEQQHASFYVIRTIEVTGNKKTKPEIILRELPFSISQQFSLQQLVKKFEQARRQLMNTTLFHEVVVALKSSEGVYADIIVEVRERWYIFPALYFKPVDRNLNQWIVEKNASLDRVNYGLKLLYNNITGRNDKVEAGISGGYTRQLSLVYEKPYVDKKLRWGVTAGLVAGKNREVNYNTIKNKQIFFKDEDRFIRNFFSMKGEVTYRKAIYTKHRIGIAFTREAVSDTIINLNPGYFQNGKNSISFPELYYKMSYFNVDYIPYPTKGFAAELYVNKRGFNRQMNLWQLSAKALASWSLLPKTFLSVRVNGQIKLPFRQAFINQRMMGYGDTYLQGYEYYVMDGVAGGILKTTLYREILNTSIGMPGKKANKQLPLRILAKVYSNTGYVYHPEPGTNPLTNKMLYSGGIGVDVITLYDFTMRLEWSFNALGQNGLFLHNKSIF